MPPIDLTRAEQRSSPEGVKLALFDVDGTIRNASGGTSHLVREALRRFIAAGYLAGIASGRPYFSGYPICKELALTGPSLFSSGSVGVNRSGEIIVERPIDIETAEGFIIEARRRNLDFELYTSSAYYTESKSSLLDLHATYFAAPSTLVADLVSQLHITKPVKLELILNHSRYEEHLPSLKDQFPKLHFAVAHGAAHPELYFVNVTDANTSIAETVRLVLKNEGVTTDQVIAFGDGESDLPLFAAVKYSVAMGNAKSMVKERASFVTKSVSEDGVAFALMELFGV